MYVTYRYISENLQDAIGDFHGIDCEIMTLVHLVVPKCEVRKDVNLIDKNSQLNCGPVKNNYKFTAIMMHSQLHITMFF